MSREAIYLAALDRIAEDYDTFDTPGYVPLQLIGRALRQRQRIAAEAIKEAAQEGSGVDGLRPVDAPAFIELIRRVAEALAKARGVKIVDEVDQRLFERDAGLVVEMLTAERERIAFALERLSSSDIRLHMGELSAQEMRAVRAFISWQAFVIRESGAGKQGELDKDDSALHIQRAAS